MQLGWNVSDTQTIKCVMTSYIKPVMNHWEIRSDKHTSSKVTQHIEDSKKIESKNNISGYKNYVKSLNKTKK